MRGGSIRRALVAGQAAAIILVLTGGMLSAAQMGGDEVNACVGPAGVVRIVADHDACLAVETPISWNSRGPEGPAGAPGQDGVSGWELVQETIPADPTPPSPTNQFVTIQRVVNCPSGKRPLSGGILRPEVVPTTFGQVYTNQKMPGVYESGVVESNGVWGWRIYAVLQPLFATVLQVVCASV